MKQTIISFFVGIVLGAFSTTYMAAGEYKDDIARLESEVESRNECLKALKDQKSEAIDALRTNENDYETLIGAIHDTDNALDFDPAACD